MNRKIPTIQKKVKEMLVVICVSYTIVSVIIAVCNIIVGTQTSNLNQLMALMFTTIAVGVLYTYQLLSFLSPLLTITIQYILATGLVLLTVYITSFFEPVSPGGYKDLFVSFSAIYIAGAIVFYIATYCEIKKMNHLLDEIQNK